MSCCFTTSTCARRTSACGASGSVSAATIPSFEFHHGHGLGVLAIGHEMPTAIKWLFGPDSENADTVRKFFARLGAAV